MSKRIHTIVLTGGPCAGKTSSLAAIMDHFTNLGHKVIVVPESATTLLTAGISPNGPSKNVGFQTLLMQTQIETEKRFYDFAKKEKGWNKVLLIFDRGRLDGAAYSSEDDWKAVLKRFSKSPVVEYDGVIHLRSVACSDPVLYTEIYKSNPVRTESTPRAAIEADQRTELAWLGHRGFSIVTNYGSASEKARATVAAIASVIGEPVPLEIESKFLIDPLSIETLKSHGIAYRQFEITQYYFPEEKSGEECRIRRSRSKETGEAKYYLTQKVGYGHVRQEIESLISKEEFLALLEKIVEVSSGTPARIKKLRTVFIFRDQVFEVDSYLEMPNILSPLDKKMILEVETRSLAKRFRFPDFLKVDRDVTGQKWYSNFSLAKAVRQEELSLVLKRLANEVH